MINKDTTEMENEIINANTKEELKKFLVDNEENFPDFTLAEYLNFLLADKNLEKAEVVKNSQIGNYAYKIFSGEKRNNSRQKILALAFAMKLSVQETNRLLYYANAKKLYAKDDWDAVIIFALNKCYTLKQTNELLTESAMTPLIE
ncbi:MAG: XRE family transcriptional regulator [Selenomonadaceae bacterium]|nr:XRE family transcriptional regulator [Selenomonadaceae bacterium]